MNRESYDRPTDHYEEDLYPIDEQICALLKERKDLSSNNPGLPPDEAISKWAKKYDFYEVYLASLFQMIRMEDYYKPRVEPTGFRKHVPVLKSIEIAERNYTVSFIRQYENASVVQLLVDWDATNDSPIHLMQKSSRNHFELLLGEQYECQRDRSGGSTGHDSSNFIVTPPLPDNIAGQEFVFKEYSDVFRETPTGLEIVIQVD
ncbi:hypothetical protein ACQKII_19700 [Lysinibacillus sp. NPDC048646]|uniref:hypothetical protein n=1 Tax=Lysinibacillus sp. NPDC048646 TaxID=3390574 RepID=UPI003D038F93